MAAMPSAGPTFDLHERMHGKGERRRLHRVYRLLPDDPEYGTEPRMLRIIERASVEQLESCFRSDFDHRRAVMMAVSRSRASLGGSASTASSSERVIPRASPPSA